MKNKKIVIFLSVIFISLLTFVACDKDSGSVSPEINADINNAEYAVLDYNDVINTFIPPDLNSDPGFGHFPPDSSGLRGNGMGGRRGPGGFGPGNRGPGGNGLHIGAILKDLNLSEDQRSAIHSYIEAHRDTMQVLFEKFKAAASAILEYGHDQRQAIIEQVRNGELTREEAKPLFEALGEEIKSMLDNNETTSAIHQEMCAAREDLFNNIASVLTSDQLETWNQWVADHPGNC